MYFNPGMEGGHAAQQQINSDTQSVGSNAFRSEGGKFPPGFLFGGLWPPSLPPSRKAPSLVGGLAWQLAPVLMIQLSSVLAAAGATAM